MPTAKNRFQILNLHHKKHIFKEKNTFLMPQNYVDKFPIKIKVSYLF